MRGVHLVNITWLYSLQPVPQIFGRQRLRSSTTTTELAVPSTWLCVLYD